MSMMETKQEIVLLKDGYLHSIIETEFLTYDEDCIVLKDSIWSYVGYHFDAHKTSRYYNFVAYLNLKPTKGKR